jgi:probable F420-dependent oxidoreductase
VGIWSPSFVWNTGERLEAAAELDELGFGTLWLGTAAGDLRLAEELLGATTRLVVATGIVNVWATDAGELAAGFHRLATAYPGRFLLGLGISHAPSVQALGKTYERPLQYFTDYLDRLDAGPHPVPADQRVLAALGPKALELAAKRSAGAHPYLVTPQYTRLARERLGPDPLLAPEQKVVLEEEPATARRIAHAHLKYYLRLPNYVSNLRSIGFTAEDVAGDGSDQLVDALYAWGTPQQIAKRISEHHDAGADHVAVQVVSPDSDVAARTGRLAREQWRALATSLLSTTPTLPRSGVTSR